MKKIFSKWLYALIFAITITVASSSAEAYYCKWVPAHWEHGHYREGHQVCYQHHHGYGYGYYGYGHRNGHGYRHGDGHGGGHHGR